MLIYAMFVLWHSFTPCGVATGDDAGGQGGVQGVHSA